jgi:type VI secretion system protein ImpM
LTPVEWDVTPVRLTIAAEPWYARAEALLMSVLGDGFELEAFDRAVQELEAPVQAPLAGLSPRIGFSSIAGAGLRLAVAAPPGVVSAYEGAIEALFAERGRRYGLWWTSGSDRVAPSLLVTDGLPPIGSFAALLDGDWRRWNWDTAGAPANTETAPALRTVAR